MDMFEILPTEILEKVLLELSVKDLLNCSLVSRSWRTNVNMDIVWRYHCRRKCFLPNTISRLDPNFFTDSKHFTPDLEPLSLWRRIFSWHNNLRNNWIARKYRRYNMAADKCESPVFCLDSDGKVAVSGHEDSTVNVWHIGPEPEHKHTMLAMLCSIPVVSVQVWNDYIVVLQKKLLQIYKASDDRGYVLVNAKSFELSIDRMTLKDKIDVQGEKFDFWYKECLRVQDSCQLTLRRLVFAVTEGHLIASVGGSCELGVWKMSGEVRANLTGFQSIRSIITTETKAYIVSGEGNTLLSSYSLSRNEAQPVLRIPGWKKILVTEEYIIAVPNRMDTTLKRIWVWDKNHVFLRTKKLSFGHISVAPVSFLIVYSENSQVTVWDPRTDTLLNTFSAGMTVGFIKPAFSTLMVTFMNTSVHVWDFMEGKRLYRIYTELEWFGDFRDQLWINPSMIIAGGVNKQMELLSFL